MADRTKKKNTDTRRARAAGAPVKDEDHEYNYMLGPRLNFAAAEAYKLLRTNIMFSFSGTEACRIIGMTSSVRGEGKSLTATNLAYTMAETGKRILLIEGDMRLPTLARRLRLAKAPGLSNLLVGMNSVNEAIQAFRSELDDGNVISLDVMVSGEVPPNPSELLGSERMLNLLQVLRDHYDYIVLDLPPVTAVTDAVIACRLVDGMLLVVRRDHAVRSSVNETLRQLRQVDARILGFVFNGAGGGSSYYRKRKGYYYKKGYYKNYYRDYGSYGDEGGTAGGA